MRYTNPSKLMNYMKLNKAKSSRSFRTMAEYVSHMDAYARNSNAVKGPPVIESNKRQERQDTPEERRRAKYAKLLAQKRLNDTTHKQSITVTKKLPPKGVAFASNRSEKSQRTPSKSKSRSRSKSNGKVKKT